MSMLVPVWDPTVMDGGSGANQLGSFWCQEHMLAASRAVWCGPMARRKLSVWRGLREVAKSQIGLLEKSEADRVASALAAQEATESASRAYVGFMEVEKRRAGAQEMAREFLSEKVAQSREHRAEVDGLRR